MLYVTTAWRPAVDPWAGCTPYRLSPFDWFNRGTRNRP